MVHTIVYSTEEHTNWVNREISGATTVVLSKGSEAAKIGRDGLTNNVAVFIAT